MSEKRLHKRKPVAYFAFVILAFVVFGSIFFCSAKDNANALSSGAYNYRLETAAAVITSADKSLSGKIEIPSRLGLFPVVAIDENAFEDCTKITEVVFPKSVKEIKNSAFSGCSSLETVVFSSELSSIGAEAFSGCAVKTLKIPSDVSFIGENAFKDCGLSGIIMTAMPETVQSKAFGENGEGETLPVIFGYSETSVKAFSEENGFLFVNISCRHNVNGLFVTLEKAPTCKEEGRKIGVFCEKCASFVGGGETAPVTEHSIVETEPVESTCTVRGSFGGKHCKFCGMVTEEPVLLPLASHTPVSAVTKKATAKENGLRVERCSVCKKVLKKTVIKKANIVYLSKTVYTFENKVFTPSVIVKNSDGKTLKNKKDYTVAYSPGRKKTGRYPVTVTFIGDYSGKVTLSFSIVPGKTAALKTTLKETAVSAKWKKVSGADGYRVYLFREGDFVKGIDTTKTAVAFKNLSRGAKYKLVVRAFKKSGKEKLFSTFSASSLFLTKPSAVKITSVKTGGGAVKITWKEQKFVTGYVVYISAKPNKGFKKIGTVKDKNSFAVKNLQKGRTYYFSVRSYKSFPKAGTVRSDVGKIVAITVK